MAQGACPSIPVYEVDLLKPAITQAMARPTKSTKIGGMNIVATTWVTMPHGSGVQGFTECPICAYSLIES